jgi:6-pyruvoyltetrahydropterin/6-carboxytetrahydropterin synthase
MKVELIREFTFEAAHLNRSAPADAINARLHGHSYRVITRVAGAVDERLGWVTDFGEIKRNCKPIIDQLDHRLLNDIDGMTDASRGDVERWLRQRLTQEQPGFSGCEVSILGDVAYAPNVRSPGTTERVAFGFAAAHFLPMLSKEHKCRRMHGHSFQIEVAGPDSAGLIGTIERLYPQLDHRVLNEVDGLENPTSEILARWLWESITELGGAIGEIEVKETCTTCCRYQGED